MVLISADFYWSELSEDLAYFLNIPVLRAATSCVSCNTAYEMSPALGQVS